MITRIVLFILEYSNWQLLTVCIVLYESHCLDHSNRRSETNLTNWICILLSCLKETNIFRLWNFSELLISFDFYRACHSCRSLVCKSVQTKGRTWLNLVSLWWNSIRLKIRWCVSMQCARTNQRLPHPVDIICVKHFTQFNRPAIRMGDRRDSFTKSFTQTEESQTPFVRD